MVLTKEDRIKLLEKARAVKAENAKKRAMGGVTAPAKTIKNKAKKTVAEPEPAPEPEIEVKVEQPIPEPPAPKPQKNKVKKSEEPVKSLDISKLPEKVEEEYDEVIYEEEILPPPPRQRKKIIKKIIQEEAPDDETEVEYQYVTRPAPSKKSVAPKRTETPAPQRPEPAFKLFDY